MTQTPPTQPAVALALGERFAYLPMVADALRTRLAQHGVARCANNGAAVVRAIAVAQAGCVLVNLNHTTRSHVARVFDLSAGGGDDALRALSLWAPTSPAVALRLLLPP